MDSTSGLAATRGFAGAYGYVPEVVWSAPGRANLIGEHTDYNDGFVLPFAIAERTTVAAALRHDDTIVVTSAAFAETARARLADIAPGHEEHGHAEHGHAEHGAVPGWAWYPLGVAWALAQGHPLPGRRCASQHGASQSCASQHGASQHGADLYIDSAVPLGGGLSSSAALEMATAGALTALWGMKLGVPELAAAGQRAENEVVGAPTGIMDQYASLLGQPDAAVFLDCRTREARLVPLRLAPPGPAGPALALVLADTGERHAHAAGGYAARRASCEKAARELGVPALRDVSTADLPRAERELDEETFRRARHVVTENARVEATVAALETGAMRTVGHLLTASHRSMRDDFEITTPALDLAVETALSAGALGARMTGGGFGGSTITLIEAHRVPALRTAIEDAFTAAGLALPRVTTVAPGAGAHQEDWT